MVPGPSLELEHVEFTFRHSFYCIPLPHLSDRHRKLLLGILWSSLARYRLFMTSGSWAGWHEKVTADDLLSTPVRLEPSWGMAEKDHERAAERIVAAVDDLRSLKAARVHDLAVFGIVARMPPFVREQGLLAVLNEAVFDLFELSEAERDLVEDFWAQSHDLLSNGPEAQALQPPTLPPSLVGTAADVAGRQPQGDLRRYLSAFLDAWNPQLEPDQELAWQVAAPRGSCPLAVGFVPIKQGSAPPRSPQRTIDRLVAQAGEALSVPHSAGFRVGQAIRAASDDGFVFVKESARRLWTASAAREDAEAVFLQLSHPERRAPKWAG